MSAPNTYELLSAYADQLARRAEGNPPVIEQLVKVETTIALIRIADALEVLRDDVSKAAWAIDQLEGRS